MPVGTPFKPGQSGNPTGRQKGSKSIKAILRELLDMPAMVKDDDGVEHQVTQLDIICLKLVKMAREGDLSSVDRIFDRLEGKPTQALNLGGQDGENPIQTRGEMVVTVVKADKGSSDE